MKTTIIPAIISKTPKEASKRIEKLLSTTNYFQLDIMDGMFVDNVSLYPKLPRIPTKACIKFVVERSFSMRMAMLRVLYEAHLMVKDPLAWIKKNEDFMVNVDTFIVQSEISSLDTVLKELAKTKKKIGLALNPETSLASVKKYLSKIDKLLIMTVHPGQYGASFLPEMLDKITEARKAAPKLDIEVDGGISPDTIELCKEAGANQFVVGSYFQNASDVKKAWIELQREI
jgi:ribulose-phosphate 3-epimerase